MQRKGLCGNCVRFDSCIYSKEPTVWQCEEFSSGDFASKVTRQSKTKKLVACEVNTESE